ncbi:hypothetical protein HMI54_001898 [Coelomomyces lativittatus]|nr:hypothetical protein HMI54_001898 [Coelomomyces lativittatus]
MSFQVRNLFSWYYTDNHRTACISLGILVAILLILNFVTLGQLAFFTLNPLHYLFLAITLFKMGIFSSSFYFFYKRIWRNYKLALYAFSGLTVILLILMLISFNLINFIPGIFTFLFEY